MKKVTDILHLVAEGVTFLTAIFKKGKFSKLINKVKTITDELDEKL